MKYVQEQPNISFMVIYEDVFCSKFLLFSLTSSTSFNNSAFLFIDIFSWLLASVAASTFFFLPIKTWISSLPVAIESSAALIPAWRTAKSVSVCTNCSFRAFSASFSTLSSGFDFFLLLLLL